MFIFATILVLMLLFRYYKVKKFQEIVGRTDYFCFVPSVEKNTTSALLPEHPRELIKKATPVPVVVGLNNKEGRLAFFGGETYDGKLFNHSILRYR